MNAPDKANEIRGAITALIAFGTALFGWVGWLIIIMLVCMVLDYLTGTFAACKDKEWRSSIARQGLWHKLGCIAALLVAGLADIAMALIVEQSGIDFEWSSYITPIVCTWYIFTELGSILENVMKLGGAVPKFLVKLIARLKGNAEEEGDNFTENE